MTNGVSQVLSVIQKDVLGLHKSVDLLNGNFDRMKLAALGFSGVMLGGAVLGGLAKVIDASHKLNDELTRTKQLGGQFAATIDQARAAAFSTSISVPTFAPSELVRMQREIGVQLQNPDAAAVVLPDAAKAATVVSHYTGEDQETIIKNLTKIVDLRAKLFSMGADGKEHVDAAKLIPELDAAARSLILAGGYLKSNDLLQMARQAGVPIKTMDTEAFYAGMTEMAVSQGASRAGTSVSSMFSQFVGGTMPVHVAKEMQDMGILGAGEYTSDHGHVVINGDASRRLQKDMQDPIAYITGPLNDIMTKKGMDGNAKLMEVFRLFGRQTTQRFVAEALSAAPQFERARTMLATIPPVNQQFDTLMNENLSTNIEAFHKSWQGLMEALGDAGVPMAVNAIQHLNGVIHDVTAWAAAHPDDARKVEEVIAAIGGITVVLGSAAVIGAAISALGILAAPTGLLALAAGLVALGKAFPEIPQWMIAMASGAAAGAGVGSIIPGVGTGIGAGVGAGVGLGVHVLGLDGASQVPGPSPANLAFDQAQKAYNAAHPQVLPKLIPENGYNPSTDETHAPGSGFVPLENVPAASPTVQRQSYIPPPANDTRPMITTIVYLDKQVLARSVSDVQARAMSLPNPGTSRYDGRVTPTYPSNLVSA